MDMNEYLGYGLRIVMLKEPMIFF